MPNAICQEKINPLDLQFRRDGRTRNWNREAGIEVCGKTARHEIEGRHYCGIHAHWKRRRIQIAEEARGQNLRCYCCGTPIIEDKFALVTMTEDEVDRVFLVKEAHRNRVSDARAIWVVRYREKRDGRKL